MDIDTSVQASEDKNKPSEGGGLEVVAAVLLGLAAVAISFSAFQTALWGGVQDQQLALSIQSNSTAVDAYQKADTTVTFDQTLFIELLVSEVCNPDPELFDEFTCEQIFGGMSQEGLTAYDVWVGNNELFPFDSPEYLAALYTEGDLAIEDSDSYFDEARQANNNGDEYELASTILTMVLFFSGISLVVRRTSLQKWLLTGASLLLVGSVINLATLSRTF